MHDPDPRPPMVPVGLLGAAKTVAGVVAVLLAVAGGVATFVVASVDVWKAWAALGSFDERGCDTAIIGVVKSIDAILLGLVQFLLAAFLWQILDPKESVLNEESMERLEQAKQILCKVVLVIIAVRLLGVVIEPEKGLRWEHLVMPAGIAALAFATASLKAKPTGTKVPAAPR